MKFKVKDEDTVQAQLDVDTIGTLWLTLNGHAILHITASGNLYINENTLQPTGKPTPLLQLRGDL